MTLREFKEQLNQIPDSDLDHEAWFISGSDIQYSDEKDEVTESSDYPRINTGVIGRDTIDGITYIYDQFEDEVFWVIHS